MQPENALVPYRTTVISSGNWIVFAPHADDESFGMGGTLLNAKKNGAKIYIVLMTDGSLGADSGVRNQEFQKACGIIGTEELIFLDVIDRQLKVTKDHINMLAEIIESRNIDTVFFPSPEEYHPDHRVTSWLVWGALQAMNYKGDMYSYEIGSQSSINTLVDVTDIYETKKELMGVYASQLTENNYIEVVEAINRSRTYTLPGNIKYAEGFYKYPNSHVSLKQQHLEVLHKACADILPKDSPLISVLIRTKNRKGKLKRCLNSIAAQSYKKIEVIVVNDGGCDITDVIDEARPKLNIKLIEHLESKGRSAAANTAMLNASGKFYNFLDDDDEFLPHHLGQIIANFRRNHGCRVFYTGCKLVDDTGKECGEYNKSFDAALMRITNYIPIHSVCFSREFFVSGVRFDEDISQFEDWDFWIQLSRLENFKHIRNISVVYHLGGDSAAHSGHHDRVSLQDKVLNKWMPKYSVFEWKEAIRAYEKENLKTAAG